MSTCNLIKHVNKSHVRKRISHVTCSIIGLTGRRLFYMVIYFRHLFSDNHIDLSDHYVLASDLYVVLSDLYVDLSPIHLLDMVAYICLHLSMVAYFCHHLSVNYVDLSDHYVDLMLTCQIIMLTCQKIIIKPNRLLSCFHSVLMPLTAIYLSICY